MQEIYLIFFITSIEIQNTVLLKNSD